MLVVYGGLIGLAVCQFQRAPTGFIPEQDQGYLITVDPAAAGLLAGAHRHGRARGHQARAVGRRAPPTPRASPASTAPRCTNAPNAGAIFVTLKPFEERVAAGITTDQILTDLRQTLGQMQEAFVLVITPPPVRGIGTGGGFKMMSRTGAAAACQALEAVDQRAGRRAPTRSPA